MRVLLVEPEYRKRSKTAIDDNSDPDEETLWYPPLGLLKLARFHKDRRDEVRFTSGCDAALINEKDPAKSARMFDRVYITTLFTYDFDKVVKTINFYKHAVGGTSAKIFVGGIMASLMPDDIFSETGIYPITGLLDSPAKIGLCGRTNIDRLAPDYSVLDNKRYAINTLYAYATRGCPNKCPWCGVSRIEAEYVPYINIKKTIRQMRRDTRDPSVLKLMDNNVLASSRLDDIVADLLKLGYGRGEFTDTQPRKQRVVDFNQGLDASHFSEKTMRLLAQLNIKPMRIAFDRIAEKKTYLRAVKLAHKHGVEEFSNYMLYNFSDTPHDLYDRLMVNIELNEKWVAGQSDKVAGKIYSYPMRFAPIDTTEGQSNRQRDAIRTVTATGHDWRSSPVWTPRFVRNIEVMKGAAHGAISPTPTLARRTIGATFNEFIANLYMPEELLRNRNKHERKVYKHEPKRKPGSGKVECFRRFVSGLLKRQGKRFIVFHEAVSPNRAESIRAALKLSKDKEMNRWLRYYLRRGE